MEGLRKILTGVGGGVGGEVVVRVVFPDRVGRVVGGPEDAAEALCFDKSRAAVGKGVGPLVSEHVGESCVVTVEEVRQLSPIHRRDGDVPFGHEPTVAIARDRDEPHRHVVQS